MRENRYDYTRNPTSLNREWGPRERFIYHYWTSIHGRTSKPKLFRLMRGDVKNSQTALNMAKNLKEASKIYSALSMPSHPYWIDYDQETRDNIDILRLLKAEQPLPILMAAAQEFDKDEFRKLTKILVVMAIRYNLICEERTGVLSNYYSDIPKSIRSGDISKAAKVFKVIKHLYPDDEKFENAFILKSIREA